MRRFMNQKGFSLIELIIAVAILTFMVGAVIIARGQMSKQTVRLADKVFANQKAIQMFQEMLALQTRAQNFIAIDGMSDNSTYYNPLMTTDAGVSMEYFGSGASIVANPAAPSDPLSGNIHTPDKTNWRYLRQITVQRNSTDSTMRQVNILVWRYASDQNPTQPGDLLAEVSGVLHTTSSNSTPTQVIDMYVLAIQNIPGWWGELPTLFSGAQLIPAILQNTNPGLNLRMHYITRTSYGRDSYYTPYTNNSYATTVTDASKFPWCYFYPGSTTGTAVSGSNISFLNPQHYYDPANPYGLQITGNMNVDGTVSKVSNSQFSTCPSYSCADYFNNGMRYPDEFALYQQVLAAAQAVVASGGSIDNSVTEISERMLIEGMLSQPQSYQNALILNLHGEMIPLPSMRNYSDAAKDPGNISSYGGPNIRVVTHPEMLYYPCGGTSDSNGATEVHWRVYSYYDGLNNPVSLDTLYPPQNYKSEAVSVISILFPDLLMDTTANNSITIIGYSGNVSLGYAPLTIWNGGSQAVTTSPEGMSATVISPYGPNNNQTLVMLFNSPLRCPQAVSITGGGPLTNTGLETANRLYNCEYIPCSPEMTTLTNPITFTKQDLASTIAGPCNTARWIIKCGAVNVGQHQIQTFIGPLAPCTFTSTTGNPVTFSSGMSASATVFPNISSTYVWVNHSNSTLGSTAYVPPWTERYQFMGDPRDCPYLDVKVGGPTVTGAPLTIGISANGGSDGPGYNWWFQNGAASAGQRGMNNDGYSGFGAAGNVTGWDRDQNETDIPRLFMAFRQGLMNSTSVFSMICGWTAYYSGYGGEIGGNQPPFVGHIPCNLTPWFTSSQTTVSGIDEILSSANENWNSVTNEQKNANVPLCYTAGTTATSWYARSWQGEICPDSMWSVWTAYGNLPTAGATATGHTLSFTAPATQLFYREDFVNIHSQITNSLDGFGRSFNRSPADVGVNAFCDGVQGGSNDININEVNNPSTICSLGATCFSIFGFPLPSQIDNSSANSRDWQFGVTTTGNTGPEWTLAPYNQYVTLSVPSVGSVNRAFYLSTNGSSPYASALCQMSLNNKTGYFLMSGFDYTAQTDPDILIQVSMTELLRSFLDGGKLYAGGAAGHITQVPLISAYLDQPTGQYNDPTSVQVCIASPVTTGVPLTISGFITVGAGPATNIWYRWPGLTSTTANYYTEEYPNYGQALTASSYTESVTMDYYLKYSIDFVNWYYVQDNTQAVLGQPDPTGTHIIATSTSVPVTYSWDVSNTTNFKTNQYYLQAEVYREQFPLDYAYHQVTFSILR